MLCLQQRWTIFLFGQGKSLHHHSILWSVTGASLHRYSGQVFRTFRNDELIRGSFSERIQQADTCPLKILVIACNNGKVINQRRSGNLLVEGVF